MFRRILATLVILAPLAACSPSNAPDSAGTAAPEATAPATAPATGPTTPPADAAGAAAAPASSSDGAPASAANGESTDAAAATVAPVTDPNAPEPRLGTDYIVLSAPQPTYGQGKIEVAEVFSYACVHCAQFQPDVDIWRQHQPADVRWEYVPAVFGGLWDNFARAYFAAEILGVKDSTHSNVFKAVHIEHEVQTGSLEEIAAWYGKHGADQAKFLETMNSFGVTAKLNRAKQFALRTGVKGTPTIIIAGKYRVEVTPDRGFEGMLATVDYLLAKERAGAQP